MNHPGRRTFANILVTGGCGFIGSAFIRHLMHDPDFTGRIINLDLMTYAAWPELAEEFAAAWPPERYVQVQGDISDPVLTASVFREYHIDGVLNCAAESHVDQSIHEPAKFIDSNIKGVFVLLDAARTAWAGRPGHFHQVGTDEVYGSLGPDAPDSREGDPLAPRSPYSASKAAADHLVSAWHHTYGISTSISRCCNNFGPWQHEEKFIPRMVLNLARGLECPIYGDGLQVREWLHVDDHASALWSIMQGAESGSIHHVGSGNAVTNRHMFGLLCGAVAGQTGADEASLRKLGIRVADRPGHDLRYGLDSSLTRTRLGWAPSLDLEAGLAKTVSWYLARGR